jgi:hypothetical protein
MPALTRAAAPARMLPRTCMDASKISAKMQVRQLHQQGGSTLADLQGRTSSRTPAVTIERRKQQLGSTCNIFKHILVGNKIIVKVFV